MEFGIIKALRRALARTTSVSLMACLVQTQQVDTATCNKLTFMTLFSFFRWKRGPKRRFHDDGDGLDGDGHDDVLHAAQQLERGTTGQASR